MPVLPRTAVIVVHGIGEQEPLETLLSFVGRGGERPEIRDGMDDAERKDGGLLESDDSDHRFVNPDRISSRSYRRIVSVDVTHRAGEIDPIPHVERREYAQAVHFYEHYWAYRFRDTVWRQLPPLILRLLRADRKKLNDGIMRGGMGWKRTSLRVTSVLLALLAGASVAVAFSVLVGSLALEGLREKLPWPDWAVTASAVALVLLVALAFAVAAGRVADGCGVVSTIRILLLLSGLVVAGAGVGALLTHGEDSGSLIVGAAGALLLVATGVLWVLRKPVGWIVVTALAGIAGVVFSLSRQYAEAIGFWRPAEALLALVIAVLPIAVGGFALRGLGDAARYLSSHPDNIRERERVRQELITLLDGLERRSDPVTKRPFYDRVILVGHSLGTVIAYDALLSYWQRVSPLIDFPETSPRLEAEVDAAETVNPALDSTELEDAAHAVEAAGPLLKPGAELDEWRALQYRLGRALSTHAVPTPVGVVTDRPRWIVSDLVTLASPLAHADVLLADGATDLDSLVRDRLFAASPPTPQRNASAANHLYRYRHWDGDRYTTRLHQSAVFAPTRWSNYYFQHDLVGGPIPTQFGAGVKDEPLGKRRPLLWNFLLHFPHTSYWGPVNGSNAVLRDALLTKLRELILHATPILVVTAPAGSEPKLREFLESVARLADGDEEKGASVQLRVLRTVVDGSGSVRREWVWPGFDGVIPCGRLARAVGLARARGLTARISACRKDKGEDSMSERDAEAVAESA